MTELDETERTLRTALLESASGPTPHLTFPEHRSPRIGRTYAAVGAVLLLATAVTGAVLLHRAPSRARPTLAAAGGTAPAVPRAVIPVPGTPPGLVRYGDTTQTVPGGTTVDHAYRYRRTGATAGGDETGYVVVDVYRGPLDALAIGPYAVDHPGAHVDKQIRPGDDVFESSGPNSVTYEWQPDSATDVSVEAFGFGDPQSTDLVQALVRSVS